MDESPENIMLGVIRRAKTKLPEGHDDILAAALCSGLRKLGKVIVDEDLVIEPGSHLALMKKTLKRLAAAVLDEETPPRDLASLTRRLQDVSREISSIEEKMTAEKGHKSGSRNSAGIKSGQSLEI